MTMIKKCSQKMLLQEDNNYLKEIYGKIKDIKEEIELTKNNDLISDETQRAKYINTLNVELNNLYKELEYIEKMEKVLEQKDSIDDYLDKKGKVKDIEFHLR